jgi:formate dehydrogenase subunit gamma
MTAPILRNESAWLTRFSLRQRAEHFSAMLLFILLVVTGMPQKWPSAAISGFVIHAMGGIDAARFVHRVCGFLFAFAVVLHLGVAIFQVLAHRVKLFSIVPDRKDFKDALTTLRYYIGATKEQAAFDRYDFRQKFEYWGMVMGSLIMVLSGLVLFFPIQVAWLLPGQLIPAAKMLHTSEGLLATLVVIVWHLYNAHLNPDVFPFDASIFTGKISRERMEKEHPIELKRLDSGPR